MIQFDGHIFLDGLNAPTRWCLVLDFLKGFSSSEICLLKKPSMALQVKRISQKHPPNIVKHQKSIWNFTCCSFCSILNTWEDDPAWNQIDLDIVFLLRWSKHYLFLSLNEHRCFWQFQFDVPTVKAGAWKGEWRELPVSPIDCEMGSDEHSYCWCFRNLAQPVYPGLFTKAFFYTVGMYKTS